MTLPFEERIEHHYFASDRLSEAHIAFRNEAWQWSVYVFKPSKYGKQHIAGADSGRSLTADAAKLAAEMALARLLGGV